MMHALVFDVFGGPEVLSYREVPAPALLPGTALNYHLEGKPPWILGYEGAGTVVAVAEGDEANVKLGARVAFADVPCANAEIVRAPLDKLVPLPEGVSFETAAAVILQGLTAQYLVRDSHALAAGELAVVHASGGGVGLLLTQLARRAGARDAGAFATASYDEDWPALVRGSSPNGRGADVVFDSVGSTLQRSLDAARVGGHVVFYGMAGGDPSPFDPRRLMDESKSLTGGDLWNVLTSAGERCRRSAELFALVERGDLRVTITRTLPLSRGGEAHALLEGRGVIGKLVLVPDEADG